jgi:transcriptional regulator with XRE-family HTH domain
MKTEAAAGHRARRLLARRLRLLRAVRGWTQEGLAAESDLHRTYVSGIERGMRNVGLDNIERLAQALGVSIGDLFSDANDHRAEGE